MVPMTRRPALFALAAVLCACSDPPPAGTQAAVSPPSRSDAAPAPADAGLPDATPAALVPDAGPPPRPGWEVASEIGGRNWPLAQRAKAIAAGAEVVKKHQCTRCHEIDGLPTAGRPFDCVSCHVFLKGLEPGERRYEDLARKYGREVIERYQRNIVHLRQVPNLSTMARRVRPEWIGGFLTAPEDLRPILEESMIRHKLEPAEVKALVRYFAAMADVPDPTRPGYRPTRLPPRPDAARMEKARKKFANASCPSCHTMGTNQLSPHIGPQFLYDMRPMSTLAPNLRFARERVRPEVIVDWILDPTTVIAGTAMPKQDVTAEDAELLRDYIYYGELEPLPPAPAADPLLEMPPAVPYEVTWEMVKERVLGNVCVHCHMNEHEKDTGPGNQGGLGFPGRGLSFRTYEMTMRGSLLPDTPEGKGKRYSVFQALPGETWPRALSVLLYRRVENLRDRVPPFQDHQRPAFDDKQPLLGMPLGLPAMTDEEIGIVRKWIEEGCPGPTAVTGMPGITDGYLVPDGPVTRNHGCEARDPEEPPPPWATRPPAPAGNVATPR